MPLPRPLPFSDGPNKPPIGSPLRHDPPPVVTLKVYGLTEAVDLIVVPAVRKGLELRAKGIKPWRLKRQDDIARFDLTQGAYKPVLLARPGLDHDGPERACC